MDTIEVEFDIVVAAQGGDRADRGAA